jgi:lipopolysaccharide transport system permease protein
VATTTAPVPARLGGRWTRALGELVAWRELTSNLVRRDLKVRHRGTFLGMLWSLTTPLLLVALYWFIFTFILQTSPADDAVRPDGQPVPFALYFFCGLVLWNLFSNAVNASTGSVVGSGYLLGKVWFPRAILPLSTVLSSMVTFAFESAVLVVLTVAVVGPPNLHVLWVPAVVAVVAVHALGLALLLSTLTVFLRDVAHFVGVLLQVWFWGTPIIYSLGYVSSRPGLVRLLELNPMTGAVVSFRNALLLGHAPPVRLLAYSAAVAALTLAVGAGAFGRWQRVFPEMV